MSPWEPAVGVLAALFVITGIYGAAAASKIRRTDDERADDLARGGALLLLAGTALVVFGALMWG